MICKKLHTPRQGKAGAGGMPKKGHSKLCPYRMRQVALPAAERRTNQEEAVWLTSP